MAHRVDDSPVREVAGADTPRRLAHLDLLKVALTAAVITAHAAMTYGAVGTWIWESDDRLSGPVRGVLDALVGIGILFALGLFFLIAGRLTTGPLRRHGPLPFLRHRLVRLGVPVAVYALVVWPLLHWLVDVVEAPGGVPSPWSTYRAQFAGGEWRSLGTGPMWFVAILLAATAGWCLWRAAVPAGAGSAHLGRTVAWAAGVIAVATFVVRIWFPIDSAQFLDLHLWIWPQCAVLFALGALGAEQGWIDDVPLALRRRLRRSLAGGVVALAVLIVLSDGPEHFKGGWHWEAAGFAGFEGVASVALSLLLLDLARRHVHASGPLVRRLSPAAYGAFVAQGPLLVVGALVLRPLGLPGDVAFALLAVAGVAGSFLLGSLATRRPRSRTLGR